MNRDFTLNIFRELLKELKNSGYNFYTLKDFLNSKSDKSVILRHDVDRLPGNSLRFAEIEKEIGIYGTYYFRIVKNSFNLGVIKKIISLGHEIGYHYEDLSLKKGNYEAAFESFKKNLSEFRKIYDVKTICMHGSPLSKWDNKNLWEKYSYKELGILCEPYIDLDYNDIFYITDTGRRWNGGISIRDKVNSKYKNSYKNTFKIIKSIKENSFPKLVLITVHPQRWNNNLSNWTIELIGQNFKNMVKKFVVKKK